MTNKGDARSSRGRGGRGDAEEGHDLALGQEPTRVPISSLSLADSPRISGENVEHTRLLADVGGPLPAIIVQRSNMRVIDGMHRLHAARLRGESDIDVLFFDGDDKDAFLLAVETNIAHGLPLSLKDRSAAARRIMRSHPLWSDGAIGKVTGLDAKTVAALRRSDEDIPQVAVRIGRDGRTRPVDATEGRKRAAELLANHPDAPLRRIARAAGVSLGTVSDVRRRMQAGMNPVPGGRRVSNRQRDVAADTEKAGPISTGRITSSVGGKPDPRVLLERLQRDPSLRFTQAGRALIRWMEIQGISHEGWELLLDSVPAHCAETVAELARECARAWQNFSVELEHRGRVSAG
ncbi:ParB N-terminal domain-containing protein [Nocardia sp. NPDC004068]|uniref:ParB N-terminal domain-containing protein n=1 Tax=Nocardia sp. NPDC004068 TaxID=3364303 RepID=UPI00369F2C8A